MGIAGTSLAGMSNAAPQSARPQFAPVVLGVSAVLIWALTVIYARQLAQHIDPFLSGLLRVFFAGVVALPFLAFTGRRPRGAQEWWLLLAGSLAASFLFCTLLSLGLGHTTAARGGLIIAVAPLLTGVASYALRRRWPRAGWWVGLGIATAGLAAFMASHANGLDGGTVKGDLIVAAAFVATAVANMIGSWMVPRIGAIGFTCWGAAISAVFAVPFMPAALADLYAHGSAGDWAIVAFLASISAIVAPSLWYWAMAHGGVGRISALQFLQPVMVVGFAAVLLAERITLPLLATAAVVLGGVALARRFS